MVIELINKTMKRMFEKKINYQLLYDCLRNFKGVFLCI